MRVIALVGTWNDRVAGNGLPNDACLRNGCDADGLRWAGLHAGRSLAFRQAIVTHVALSHNALAFGVFWNVVWAFQNTILAADALIVQVKDNSGFGVFFISQNGATIRTCWVFTVMAGCCHCLLIGMIRCAAMNQTDISPCFILLQTVEAMTCRNAGLAACAAIQIYGKCILLARLWSRQRDQLAIVGLKVWPVGAMIAGKTNDRSV